MSTNPFICWTEQSFTSIDWGFYHFNKSAKCKYTTNLLLHDIFLPLIQFSMVSSHSSFDGSSGEFFCWLKRIKLNESISRTKDNLLCWKSIFSLNNVFLHCSTSSFQCTAIIVGLSNTLLTNIESKNLPFFIQHTSTWGICSQGTWCHTPWRILDRTQWLSHSFLGEHPQEILLCWKSSCQATLVTKTAPVPAPSHNAKANTVDPPAYAAPAASALP